MNDADEEDVVLPLGVAGLIAIELGEWLPQYADSETRRLLSKIQELSEIQQRALANMAEPGDRFRALRLLVAIPKSEFIHLFYELCRVDDDAILPWQLIFNERPKTGSQKAKEKHLKRRVQALQKEEEENFTVFRVTDYRKRTGATLADALQAVADGNDRQAAGLLQPKEQFRSIYKVRAQYMAGIKRAKQAGYAYKPGAFFKPGRAIALDDLTRKGRRKK